LGGADRLSSYAEMDPVEKNKISHRYKALSKLKEYLQQQN
jgi:inosine triphosphate pyrophosphatase